VVSCWFGGLFTIEVVEVIFVGIGSRLDLFFGFVGHDCRVGVK
jgi:hypothetical protein